MPTRINKHGDVVLYSIADAKTNFVNWYKTQFKQDASELSIWPDCQFNADYYDLLFTNEVADHLPTLNNADIDKLRLSPQSPIAYKMFGFEGHGCNSLRIVYCHFENDIRVYIRVGYGGLYMDEALQTSAVQKIIHNCDRLVQFAIKNKQPLEFFSGSTQQMGSLVFGYNKIVNIPIDDITNQAIEIENVIKEVLENHAEVC